MILVLLFVFLTMKSSVPKQSNTICCSRIGGIEFWHLFKDKTDIERMAKEVGRRIGRVSDILESES